MPLLMNNTFGSQTNYQNSSSSKSLRRQDETGLHKLESLGSSLPIQVSEVLLLSDELPVSVSIDESGWAWLVCGRRLFVWKFSLPKGNKSLPNCRELNLSPSDLAHQARLVCVYNQPNSLIPSCIAVSPEGAICYWPSIAQESSSVEISADLQGQECESLINLQPHGCLLSTTTGTLMLVIPSNLQGQKLLCRPLKTPDGLFGGLSRRMSSIIFGGLPNQSSESKLVKVAAVDLDDEAKAVFVLSSDSLKKWVIKPYESDDLLYSCEVDKILRENFLTSIWGRDKNHPSDIQIWVLDFNICGDEIYILAAAVNTQSPGNIHYGLAKMRLSAPVPLIGFPSFVTLKCSQAYSVKDEKRLINYQFLISDHTLFLYKDNIIQCINVEIGDEIDVVKLHSPRDRFIGAGLYHDKPCFFSFNNGILCLKKLYEESSIDTSCNGLKDCSMDIPLTNLVKLDDSYISALPASNKQMESLKAAIFLFHQNKMAQCLLEIKKFVPSFSCPSQVDNPLDMLILQFCQASIMDDRPTADPRWAEKVKTGSLSSTSLIILQQLHDKLETLRLFINFLKKTDLWAKLGVVSIRRGTMATSLVLCEYAEKIIAAITLKKNHAQFNDLLNPAIERVITSYRGLHLDGKLTPQDLFYSEVSKIGEIFSSMVESLTETPTSELSTQDISRRINDTNDVLLAMLQEIRLYRQAHKMEYIYPLHPDLEPDYIPWTSCEYQGLRGSLLQLHKITVDHGLKLAEDIPLQNAFYKQLLNLSDIIIEGYHLELVSLPAAVQSSFISTYEQERYRLIMPFFNESHYEKAVFLAEKYQDFLVLVQFCDVTKDDDRLGKYMDQFEDMGICAFVFKWLYDEGKFDKLLTLDHHKNELAYFLNDYPSLSWLNFIKNEKYLKAAEQLLQLASIETKYLNKKKSYLTFCKLAMHASDMDDETYQHMDNKYNKEMELVLLQETLPASVVENLGMDTASMKVLKPIELLEVYISIQNVAANEYDFKKALDLLEFITNEELQSQYRVKIWCECILRDNWDKINPDMAVEALEDTLLFKTIILSFAQGHDLEDILPDPDEILNCETMKEVTGPHLEYLLKSGYEHIMKTVGVQ